jgi:hypothetical protein
MKALTLYQPWAHLVQVVAPTRGSSGWVAVFEIRDVAT